MKNDKDIWIETEENIDLHDKIKSGARALDKKIEQLNRYQFRIWRRKN